MPGILQPRRPFRLAAMGSLRGYPDFTDTRSLSLRFDFGPDEASGKGRIPMVSILAIFQRTWFACLASGISLSILGIRGQSTRPQEPAE